MKMMVIGLETSHYSLDIVIELIKKGRQRQIILNDKNLKQMPLPRKI
jgi:hypothetical protein